jgi:hypothetical protein
MGSRAENLVATRCGHHTDDCPAVLGPVKPLRFAPSLTGCGLDLASGSARCLAIA